MLIVLFVSCSWWNTVPDDEYWDSRYHAVCAQNGAAQSAKTAVTNSPGCLTPLGKAECDKLLVMLQGYIDNSENAMNEYDQARGSANRIWSRHEEWACTPDGLVTISIYYEDGL